MFKCQEYMIDEQLIIAEQFQSSIEIKYALCVSEIAKINQSIANNPSPDSVNWHGVRSADKCELKLISSVY